jgi:urease accessory protein
MIQLYDFLTLADSGLPTGGYAFSSGLEAAKALGLFEGPGALDGYFDTVIWATAHSELPFVASCYSDGDIGEDLKDVVAFYDAMMTAPPMIQASVVLGRNLLRVMMALYPSDRMAGVHRFFVKHALPTHHTLVFGATLSVTGFALLEAKQIFLYQFLRDQISSAVRLGCVGPMEAARVQKAHHQTCVKAVAKTEGMVYTNAVRLAPQWDIAQSFHHHLYSRLFQS